MSGLEIAAEDRERELSAIYEHVPGILFYISIDPDGEFRFASMSHDGLVAMGLRREQVIGARVRDVIPSPSREMVLEHYREAIRSGQAVRWHETSVYPAGTRHGEVAVTPLIGPGGMTTHLIGIVHDVTQRKETEEHLRASEERLRIVSAELIRVFDTAATGLTHCSRDWRYLSANATYAHWIGLPVEQIVGRPIVDVMGKAAVELIRPRVERVLLGERMEYEEVLPIAGVPKPVHIVYAPDTDGAGNVVGWVASVTDISERKRAETALREANEKLKDADRRKDEFLAMLGHELRNPLAAIQLSVAMLRGSRALDPEQERACQMIHRQTEQLVRLVDDLLEISRITTGKLTLKKARINVTSLVHNTLETCRPLLEDRRLEVHVELPPEEIAVEADPARLTQALVNLVTNAAKYTPSGGRIRIRAAREDGKLVLAVKDTGIGIAPEMLEKIFEALVQMEQSLDRAQGGLGLGLALVRKIVEMHGGTVVAVSEGPGKGSEFVVRVPIGAGEAATATAAAPAAARPFRRRRVLVVDDNLDLAEGLAALLARRGHEVRLAHDGPAALRTVEQFHPDVVMLDIGLPILDGYEVARRLRRLPGGEAVTLIALSGYGQEKDRQQSKEAGFNLHFVKPDDLERIEEAVSFSSRAGGQHVDRP
jgi:two-component system CheB/CheR fusion protein